MESKSAVKRVAGKVVTGAFTSASRPAGPMERPWRPHWRDRQRREPGRENDQSVERSFFYFVGVEFLASTVKTSQQNHSSQPQAEHPEAQRATSKRPSSRTRTTAPTPPKWHPHPPPPEKHESNVPKRASACEIEMATFKTKSPGTAAGGCGLWSLDFWGILTCCRRSRSTPAPLRQNGMDEGKGVWECERERGFLRGERHRFFQVNDAGTRGGGLSQQRIERAQWFGERQVALVPALPAPTAASAGPSPRPPPPSSPSWSSSSSSQPTTPPSSTPQKKPFNPNEPHLTHDSSYAFDVKPVDDPPKKQDLIKTAVTGAKQSIPDALVQAAFNPANAALAAGKTIATGAAVSVGMEKGGERVLNEMYKAGRHVKEKLNDSGVPGAKQLGSVTWKPHPRPSETWNQKTPSSASRAQPSAGALTGAAMGLVTGGVPGAAIGAVSGAIGSAANQGVLELTTNQGLNIPKHSAGDIEMTTFKNKSPGAANACALRRRDVAGGLARRAGPARGCRVGGAGTRGPAVKVKTAATTTSKTTDKTTGVSGGKSSNGVKGDGGVKGGGITSRPPSGSAREPAAKKPAGVAKPAAQHGAAKNGGTLKASTTTTATVVKKPALAKPAAATKPAPVAKNLAPAKSSAKKNSSGCPLISVVNEQHLQQSSDSKESERQLEGEELGVGTGESPPLASFLGPHRSRRTLVIACARGRGKPLVSFFPARKANKPRNAGRNARCTQRRERATDRPRGLPALSAEAERDRDRRTGTETEEKKRETGPFSPYTYTTVIIVNQITISCPTPPPPRTAAAIAIAIAPALSCSPSLPPLQPSPFLLLVFLLLFLPLLASPRRRPLLPRPTQKSPHQSPPSTRTNPRNPSTASPSNSTPSPSTTTPTATRTRTPLLKTALDGAKQSVPGALVQAAFNPAHAAVAVGKSVATGAAAAVGMRRAVEVGAVEKVFGMGRTVKKKLDNSGVPGGKTLGSIVPTGSSTPKNSLHRIKGSALRGGLTGAAAGLVTGGGPVAAAVGAMSGALGSAANQANQGLNIPKHSAGDIEMTTFRKKKSSAAAASGGGGDDDNASGLRRRDDVGGVGVGPTTWREGWVRSGGKSAVYSGKTAGHAASARSTGKAADVRRGKGRSSERRKRGKAR
ncbi:hypothetical protein DFJ73DRAFT_944619 [Zopfochytrium polystomum]|nr:hypothetical protein DFJ73DRAFT_944619 [Zopfochytrium polystomum]